MRVVVDKNVIDENFFRKRRLSRFMHDSANFNIQVGCEYVVQGIAVWAGHPFYYIYQDVSDNYPVPVYHGLFRVIDEMVSSYWSLAVNDRAEDSQNCYLLFSEWAEDFGLYERLLEGDPAAITLFAKYREKFSKEADGFC